MARYSHDPLAHPLMTAAEAKGSALDRELPDPIAPTLMTAAEGHLSHLNDDAFCLHSSRRFVFRCSGLGWTQIRYQASDWFRSESGSIRSFSNTAYAEESLLAARTAEG